MKLVVVIKTATGGAINDEDAFARSGRTLPGVLGASDAHAIEAALQLREAGVAHEIVAVAVAASSEVLGGLREALAMGINGAVLVADDGIEAADLSGRSRILAAALQRLGGDAFLYCPWTGDVDGSLLWAATAERMRLPALFQASRVAIADGHATTERQTEAGDVTMTAPLPCLIEVSETLNRARRSTMQGRIDAKRKSLSLLMLADLGLDPAPRATTRIVAVDRPAPRRTPEVIDDPRTAAAQIAGFLVDRGLIR